MPIGTLESVLASLNPERDFATAVSQYTKDDFCGSSGFPPERVVVAPLSAGDRFRPITDKAQIADVRARYGLATSRFCCRSRILNRARISRCSSAAFTAFCAELPSWDGNLVLVGNVKAGLGVEGIHEEIDKEPELAHTSHSGGRRVSMNTWAVCIAPAKRFFFLRLLKALGFLFLKRCSAGRRSYARIPVPSRKLPVMRPSWSIRRMRWRSRKPSSTFFRIPARRRELVAQSLRQAGRFSWEASAEKVAEAYRMAVNLLGTT